MEKYTVYTKSGSIKNVLFVAGSYSEAWEFCNDHNWEWFDENEFCWDLDFVE